MMDINLARFKKPSRYIGNEINIVRKDASVRVALCFPDTYEVGMSHLGMKILYEIVNRMPFASAERVFSPWVDLESYLLNNDLPLTSLENRMPLREFDIVGFSLQYELSYTNIFNILRLGKIPIRADDRDKGHPIVIAGGPCAVNPLPLSPFIDAFVIGDGEEIIKEIVTVYSEVKGSRREDILKELSRLDGIYVPLIHDIQTHPDSAVAKKKTRIRRRIIHDLDLVPFPVSPVVPYAPIVHDRVAIEISRGCTRGCRFCQAGMIYRPLRERSVENILNLAHRSLSRTGYDEISFTSLSTGDYTCLYQLIKGLNDLYSDKQVAISLPSLRVGSLSKEILEEIKKVRKTGFTIAPEAGTERLRSVINKDFTENEYEETLKIIFKEGWRNIKLYFMIGLPTETETDINGIINMVRMASGIGRTVSGRTLNINVGVSAFVPKPHTPFQWIGQMPFEELIERQDYLRKGLRRRGINFKGQDIRQSLLEAVFSRGDKRCASLLENAWKEGCRFDGWSEFFDFDRWLRAFEKAGIDIFEYASRGLEVEEELPWDFIDTGIKKNPLKIEYKKALNEKITEDCRKFCYGCGLGCKTEVKKIRTLEDTDKIENENLLSSYPLNFLTSYQKIRLRLRVQFSKTDILRYLSHQELMTAILRAIRRANIPMVYTSGFHPHPEISFGPALPAGVEGLNEYFDIKIYSVMGVDEFKQRLNSELPQGIEAIDVIRLDKKVRSLSEVITCYKYEMIIDRDDVRVIEDFMSQPACIVLRDKKRVDIRAMVKEAVLYDDILRLTLIDKNSTKVRLFEILQVLLSKLPEEIYQIRIKRTGVYSYCTEEDKTKGMFVSWQSR